MRSCLGFVALAVLAVSALAQTLPPGVSLVATYPGSSLNLPGPLGGIEFSADGSILYCGTAADSFAGEVRALPVQRDPVTGRITGFGQATIHCAAPFIDGGLQFGPGGTLFWVTFSNHQLGQLAPGGMPVDFPLAASGVAASTGSLEFVPAGLPNAGDLLIASYNSGDIYTITMTPNGDGTFTPDAGSATVFVALPNGTEGIRHIPSGPNAGDMAIVNFSLGNITLMSINPTTGLPVVDVLGNPVLTPYVTGITGAEGLAFDPLTNDFFISTFGSGDQLVQITGFPTGGPILGPCARGNVGLSVGPPIDVLTVNGSTGGIGRRVDVPIGGAISVQVSPSSLSTVPSLFAIYGYIGQPGSAELTPVGSLGDFCFPPNDFIPEYPGTFVLTSSYFPGHPSALVPSTAAPWSTTDADGLPHRYLVTFQGVIDDPSASTGYAVTNAIIVAIL